jgi:FtsH-binding integral membrane protein
VGTLTGGRDNAGVRIDASGNPSADYWIQSPAAANSANPYWEALDQVYSFTATSLTMTLDFADITDYSGATTNTLLDSVVVSPTPEPTVTAGAALGIMALLRRSRRRSFKADFRTRS